MPHSASWRRNRRNLLIRAQREAQRSRGSGHEVVVAVRRRDVSTIERILEIELRAQPLWQGNEERCIDPREGSFHLLR